MNLKEKLCMAISSCGSYSDLWDNHVTLLNENWSDREIITTIVTDRITDKQYEDVSVFAAGDNLEMPDRLRVFLQTVETEYILITLDDYYVTKKIENSKIERAIKLMDKVGLDYLRFWPYPHEKKKIEGVNKAYWIELSGNYKVNLYPGIWRKTFLESTLKNGLSAWEYEVLLTERAKDFGAKCAYSTYGEFPILDVIRKGKILHPAKRYLDSRGLKTNRETIPYLLEFKLNVMYYAKEIVPKPILRAVKRAMKKRGYKFFTEDI